MNSDLYLATYHKFKNLLIPDLPDIIFTSLINNKTQLEKLLNTRFNLDKLIKYIINKKIKTRAQIMECINGLIKNDALL